MTKLAIFGMGIISGLMVAIVMYPFVLITLAEPLS